MDARPQATLSGFVSTSVLTSSDGLFGDNVEETRISDAPVAPKEQEGDYKPLYERLQELKEKKESDWKEKHNPFAPPKALDDEEIEFIRELESRQADSERKRQEQHNEDLAEFLLARGSAKPSNGTTTTGSRSGVPVFSEETLQKYSKADSQKKMNQSSANVVVVKAKRKAKEKKQPKKNEASGDKKQKIDANKSNTTTLAVEKKKESTPPVGLVAYGSDSDSD